MQDRKYNKQSENGHDDPFLAYFKDSLQDHQLPVDDSRWDELNQRLRWTSRKKSLRLMIVYSGVAAAVVLLVILSGLLTNKTVEPGLLSMKTPQVKETSDQATSIQITSKQITSDQLSSAVQPTGLSGTHPMRLVLSKPVGQAGITGGAVLLAANDSVTGTQPNKEKTCESAVSVEKGSAAAMAAADSSSLYGAGKARTILTEKARSVAEQENLLAFNSRRPKNSDWAFGATIGTYNQSEEPQAYHTEYLNAAPSAVFGEEYAVNVSNSDPEIVEYAPPVTLGLLIRKRLTSMFSLETGIDYSRLSTSYKNHFEPNYHSRLTLQYVGIPLQLVINWLTVSDLTVYSSAGPMVEKGIKYDYSEHAFATRRYVHYTGSIDGFQWSAAASAGISYRFVKKWNVYLESHVSHFFDNNQPVSIRTEKRTIIGLNSGFRYDF